MRLSEGTSLKTVQILKHTTKNSAEQTAMRTKLFKHISGKEKTHKHKQICGIVPGVGANFLFIFFGSFLMGEKKHKNKIPPPNPGTTPVKILFAYFFLCVFFSAGPKRGCLNVGA